MKNVIIDYKRGTFDVRDPFYAEFNGYLEKIGIHVAFSEYYNTNYLTIFVYSIDDVVQARQIILGQAKDIERMFFALTRKHLRFVTYFRYLILRKSWKRFFVDQVYSFEITCMERVVRRSKNEVKRELENKLGIYPKDFFCHSEYPDYKTLPGYAIVLSSPIELSAINKKTKDEIAELCNQIVRKNDLTGFCSKYQVAVDYYGEATYGMSRED